MSAVAEAEAAGEGGAGSQQVRGPKTWTIARHDGPNYLGLRCDALPEHQMALIPSDCAPSRRSPQGLEGLHNQLGRLKVAPTAESLFCCTPLYLE